MSGEDTAKETIHDKSIFLEKTGLAKQLMPGRMSTCLFPQLGRLSTLYKGELFIGKTVKCTKWSLFRLRFRLYLYL